MATAKIAALMIRTLAKPLANSLKSSAANSPTFKRFCISIAQGYHRIEETLKMRFLGYKVEAIRPLNEAKAVELGSSFLAEFFIFGVAGTVVVTETVRSSLKSSAHNRAIDEALTELKSDRVADAERVDSLSHTVEILEKENDALRSAAQSLVAITALKEAKERAWLPGLVGDSARLEMELVHVKVQLDSAHELAVRRLQRSLSRVEAVDTISGTVAP
ncbi:optic atrophy 3 protein-domain-containing protein [Chytriomyces sp. MP71]|nr:optic atrophy 3 protein-domain-containing protein [Chytriomyces sp. MP71]